MLATIYLFLKKKNHHFLVCFGVFLLSEYKRYPLAWNFPALVLNCGKGGCCSLNKTFSNGVGFPIFWGA